MMLFCSSKILQEENKMTNKIAEWKDWEGKLKFPNELELEIPYCKHGAFAFFVNRKSDREQALGVLREMGYQNFEDCRYNLKSHLPGSFTGVGGVILTDAQGRPIRIDQKSYDLKSKRVLDLPEKLNPRNNSRRDILFTTSGLYLDDDGIKSHDRPTSESNTHNSWLMSELDQKRFGLEDTSDRYAFGDQNDKYRSRVFKRKDFLCELVGESRVKDIVRGKATESLDKYIFEVTPVYLPVAHPKRPQPEIIWGL